MSLEYPAAAIGDRWEAYKCCHLHSKETHTELTYKLREPGMTTYKLHFFPLSGHNRL
jgi:hypothetical protein